MVKGTKKYPQDVMNERVKGFENKSRSAGLKITHQRVEVYKALIESDEHPSAEMIFRKVRQVIPTISLDTVNRTLLTFSDVGIAFIVEGSGDVKRFDGNLENHQHFKCIKCKSIVDFSCEPIEDIKIPADIRRRFKVLRKTIYIEGICDLCEGKN